MLKRYLTFFELYEYINAPAKGFVKIGYDPDASMFEDECRSYIDMADNAMPIGGFEYISSETEVRRTRIELFI